MKTVLIACETIEDEIKGALNRLGLDYPVIWLEGGLHNSPNRLRDKLTEVFAEADGRCERLILTLGYCGGGVSDITTGGYTTVLPLADDCISLLLGSMTRRRETSVSPTYYLTDGWMRHENNMVTSYERAIEMYGQARADRINRIMLANYHRFGLVDTGTYDLKAAEEKVGRLAALVNLTTERLPGDYAWIDGLLLGPHDDPNRYLVLPPHSRLDFDSWRRLLENT